jgi:hypothetical protein
MSIARKLLDVKGGIHPLLLMRSGVRNAKMAILALPGKLTGSNPKTPAVMAEKHGPSLARHRCGAECAPIKELSITARAATAERQENQRWQIR